MSHSVFSLNKEHHYQLGSLSYIFKLKVIVYTKKYIKKKKNQQQKTKKEKRKEKKEILSWDVVKFSIIRFH